MGDFEPFGQALGPLTVGRAPEPMDEEALERQWSMLHNSFTTDLQAAALRFMDRETFFPADGKASPRVRLYTPPLRSLMESLGLTGALVSRVSGVPTSSVSRVTAPWKGEDVFDRIQKGVPSEEAERAHRAENTCGLKRESAERLAKLFLCAACVRDGADMWRLALRFENKEPMGPEAMRAAREWCAATGAQCRAGEMDPEAHRNEVLKLMAFLDEEEVQYVKRLILGIIVDREKMTEEELYEQMGWYYETPF